MFMFAGRDHFIGLIQIRFFRRLVRKWHYGGETLQQLPIAPKVCKLIKWVVGLETIL